jgi:hypothetical protein
MTYYKEKEFKCPYCRKQFNKKRQLKSHIKDAHPDRLPECVCTFSQRLVGDGCEFCNSNKVEEYE